MTDIEISRKLALAIGYAPKDVRLNLAGKISVRRLESPQGYAVPGWYRFDYRDGETIWPIAERFNAFPHKKATGRPGWAAVTEDAWSKGDDFVYADTAAKAVALAVIKSQKGKPCSQGW